jgi:hypothetical protein
MLISELNADKIYLQTYTSNTNCTSDFDTSATNITPSFTGALAKLPSRLYDDSNAFGASPQVSVNAVTGKVEAQFLLDPILMRLVLVAPTPKLNHVAPSNENIFTDHVMTVANYQSIDRGPNRNLNNIPGCSSFRLGPDRPPEKRGRRKDGEKDRMRKKDLRKIGRACWNCHYRGIKVSPIAYA